jgi:GDYXXLXY motif protein
MRRVTVLAALQVAAILGWAAHHERVMATAPTFRIALQPFDPHDLLRGRYFVLNPEDGRLLVDRGRLSREEVRAFLGDAPAELGARALVGFCPEGRVHRVCALRRAGDPLPLDPSRLWVKALVDVSSPEIAEPVVSIDLGLHKFFLPDRVMLPADERTPGWELEVSYRPRETLLPRRLFFGDRPVG